MTAGRTGILVALLVALSSASSYGETADNAHYRKAETLIEAYKACPDSGAAGVQASQPKPGESAPDVPVCDRKELRQQAIDELTEAIKSDPKQPEYYLARGVLYREETNESAVALAGQEGSKTEVRAVIDRAHDDLSACADLAGGARPELRFTCRKELALLLCSNKREQEGYAVIDSLINRNGSDLPGGDFYKIRYDCSDKSNKDQNIADLRKAIVLYEKRKDYGSPTVMSDLYYTLYSLHREMKRYREALADIKEYGVLCKRLTLGCDEWALKGYELVTRADMNRSGKWTRVGAADSYVYYLDVPDTVFQSADYRIAWVRTEPEEELVVASSQAEREKYHYQTEVTRWHFACQERQYSMDRKTYYDVDGGVISSLSLSLEELNMLAEPDTIGAALLEAVCKLTPSRQKK